MQEEVPTGLRQRTQEAPIAVAAESPQAHSAPQTTGAGPTLALPQGLSPRRRAGHLGAVAMLALAAETAALIGHLVSPPAGLAEAGLLGARIVLGLLALLVLPGYALTAALFPRRHDLDGFERVALTAGLSVAQVPLLALAVDRLPWGLSPLSMVVSVGAVTRLWCLVAAIRLGRLADDGHVWGGWRPRLWWPAATRLERVSMLVCAALVGVTGWALLTIATQPKVPALTEFYVLGQEGLAENYPRAAAPGQPVQVTVGVVNREGRPTEYRAVVRQRENVLAQTPRMRVAPQETWSDTVSFALREYGFGQRVELLLFREEEVQPYRRLQLVIDAPPPGVPTPVRALQTPLPRR